MVIKVNKYFTKSWTYCDAVLSVSKSLIPVFTTSIHSSKEHSPSWQYIILEESLKRLEADVCAIWIPEKNEMKRKAMTNILI